MSGNWLESVVLPAHIGERVGGALLLAKTRKQEWVKNIQTVFADGGFGGATYQKFILKLLKYRLEIVNKEPDQKGFSVLPKRWLIEQVFGCWGRNRRLSKDYEQNTDMSRATLQVASIHRFLRRLKHQPNSDTSPTQTPNSIIEKHEDRLLHRGYFRQFEGSRYLLKFLATTSGSKVYARIEWFGFE